MMRNGKSRSNQNVITKPHIIIMDEPTNHLDLGSKETIKMMLE